MFAVDINSTVSKLLVIFWFTNPSFESLPARIKKTIYKFCGLFTLKAEWGFFPTDEIFDVMKNCMIFEVMLHFGNVM